VIAAIVSATQVELEKELLGGLAEEHRAKLMAALEATNKSNDSIISITVQQLGGDAVPLNINSAATLDELKDTIQEQLGLSPVQQTLVFAKKQLEQGDVALYDHGIRDGSSLCLLISELVEPHVVSTPKRVLTIGLDNGGKTTILYQFKLGEVVTSIPTIGFNVEAIEYKNRQLQIWDVGGQDKVRPLWRHYYESSDALMFVVDSSDRDRIGQARAELMRALSEEELKDAPLLVFANKQDLPSAMCCSQIVERLGLHTLRCRAWYIQAVCATSGDGLYEGLDWLCGQ